MNADDYYESLKALTKAVDRALANDESAGDVLDSVQNRLELLTRGVYGNPRGDDYLTPYIRAEE